MISFKVAYQLICLIVILLTSAASGKISPLAVPVLESVLIDSELQLSSKCLEALTHVYSVITGPSNQLQPEVNWPFIVADSIASVPPDVRTKQMANWGDFDPCLSIQTDSFGGKYCLYRQHFNFSLQSTQRLFSSLPKDFPRFFRLETVSGSICLPSTCSDEDAYRIIQNHIAEPDTIIEIRSGCNVRDSKESENNKREELFWQIVLSVWISFLMWATWKTLPGKKLKSTDDDSENDRILDKNQNPANGSLEKKPDMKNRNSLLKCFSLRENTRLVFQESNDEYPFIYFYRFVFIVVGTGTHIFQIGPLFYSTLTLVNFVHFKNQSILAGLGTYSSHGMGLTLVWAGFLGFKGRYIELCNTGKFNIFKAYVNRLLRTLPTVFGCYLLILSFPRDLVSGPVWKEMSNRIRGTCIKNWWTELTFTQTFLHPNDWCLGPTWILAPDIQFFTVSFLFIYLYHRRPELTRFVVIAVICCGVILQGLYKRVNGYPAFLMFGTYDLKQLSDDFYIHTSAINYISSYFLGFFVGIAVHEKWKVSASNFQRFRCFWWSGTLSLFVLSYSWAHSWKGREPSIIEQVVYGSIQRTLMALFAAGLLYWNCSYHDFLRHIMNIRIFSILGQFNYSSYMGHFLVMFLDIGSLKQPLDYSLWSFATRTISILILGIIFGFFIHLLFEAPFVRLSRHLFVANALKVQEKRILMEEKVPQKGTINNNTDIQENRSTMKLPTIPSMSRKTE